jgi:hypothetical protein
MFNPNCQVTLFRRSVLSDGSSACDGGTVFDGFFMEHHRTCADGRSEDFSELLLVPDAEPAPGDEVEIKGLRRNIARVRSCTDLKGTVRCYRCSFLRQ